MKRLWTTFRYTYAGLRGQILGWGVSLALFGLLIVSFYGVFADEQEQFQQMIANYPPEFLAFFGASADSMLTPEGFLGMYSFSMLPVIVGIFAVIAGGGLIASDEERGRLDLILAHPVGRHSFFFGRSLGLLAACISILAISWLGFCLLLGGSGLGLNGGQMAVPFISLLVQLLVYATLALLLSMLLPSRSLASTVAGAVMVIGYMISSFASLDERLAAVARLTPYHYYQSVLSFADLNLGWLFALLGISVLMVLLSWWRFARRDIRLSGEGSWRLPLLSRRQSKV